MKIKRAGLLKRLVAGIIDTFIEMAFILCAICFYAKGLIIPGVVVSVVAIGYIVFQDALFKSQSIGKRIMGIQCYSVVNQEVANYKEVFVRGGIRLFFILSCFLVVLDLFAAIVDKDNRRFSDLTAGTMVIEMIGH